MSKLAKAIEYLHWVMDDECDVSAAIRILEEAAKVDKKEALRNFMDVDSNDWPTFMWDVIQAYLEALPEEEKP